MYSEHFETRSNTIHASQTRMPLIRTKDLCARGHRLDGRHRPIKQAGPYLPTPVGAWHSSSLPYPLPNPRPNIPPKTFCESLHPQEENFPFLQVHWTKKIITLTAQPQKQKEHSTQLKATELVGPWQGRASR